MASLVFRLKRDGIATSYVDRLVVELVADSSTFASLITELMFGDEVKTSVCERIRHGEGALLEVATGTLFGHSIVGIVHGKESRMETELIQHLLQGIDTRTSTRMKLMLYRQLVSGTQFGKIAYGIK